MSSAVLQDTAASLLAFIGALLLVKAGRFLSNSCTLGQQKSRKLVHICAGPCFILLWPLYSNASSARFFAALVPAANFIWLFLVGRGVMKDNLSVKACSRDGDRRELLRGPLLYVLVLLLATLFYWRDSPIGLAAVALMCGGDGLADLVGQQFGSFKLPHNKAKTWAGSTAMLLGGSSLAMAFIALFQWSNLLEPHDMPASRSVLVIAAAATLVESLPLPQLLDDNLTVPAAAVTMGHLLF